ncbi:polysaccharide deacetylase family protein [Tepidibacter formicigenes]|jgi:peptidoglycan/xylan/chitin deacetylase (PgdA/CDA1 family)|uniref:Peptidoglycan/xylan/chitin deacetylase, PgdA/CDA1 family n=1 Tax=Tepidibacter formicigenes DSM 15518 TaxID=1123349 RepID=A0A1M6JD80_9FIRM|nr:polysaccharide deacetylase family protein [Tepidibacter formicigenes]SHJ44613.1 Peptidoglycan/xylan/chitin deacetylase, PgdA/CDA1 family [Tepidibacter formicigenes DSM 15518]
MIVIFNKKKVLALAFILLLIGVGFNLRDFSVKSFNSINEPFYKGNKENSNYVAITCNVDWGNECIDEMLKILNEENIKITFMVTGRWAEKYPEILLKIKKEGHEIGNHGYKHIDYSKLNYNLNYREIKKSKKIIETIIKEKTVFFEPPSGYYNKDTVKAAQDLNYIPIKWSIDTIDWKYKENPNEIIKRVKSKKIEDGSIILIHPTKGSVESLKAIINIVRENGYEVGKLSNIFKVE